MVLTRVVTGLNEDRHFSHGFLDELFQIQPSFIVPTGLNAAHQAKCNCQVNKVGGMSCVELVLRAYVLTMRKFDTMWQSGRRGPLVTEDILLDDLLANILQTCARD